MFAELSPFKKSNNVIEFTIKVTPKSSKNAIGKIIDIGNNQDAIQIYITEPPEDGKANSAIIELIAKSWKIKKSDIEIKSGHSSRIKKIVIHTTEVDKTISYLSSYL